MATIEGARALGIGAEVGSLEVGKQADVVVVSVDGFHQWPQEADGNPYSLLVYSTKASDVETVVIAGRVVVREGRVATLDAAAVMADARAIRSRHPLATGPAGVHGDPALALDCRERSSTGLRPPGRRRFRGPARAVA